MSFKEILTGVVIRGKKGESASVFVRILSSQSCMRCCRQFSLFVLFLKKKKKKKKKERKEVPVRSVGKCSFRKSPELNSVFQF